MVFTLNGGAVGWSTEADSLRGGMTAAAATRKRCAAHATRPPMCMLTQPGHQGRQAGHRAGQGPHHFHTLGLPSRAAGSYHIGPCLACFSWVGEQLISSRPGRLANPHKDYESRGAAADVGERRTKIQRSRHPRQPHASVTPRQRRISPRPSAAKGLGRGGSRLHTSGTLWARLRRRACRGGTSATPGTPQASA